MLERKFLNHYTHVILLLVSNHVACSLTFDSFFTSLCCVLLWKRPRLIKNGLYGNDRFLSVSVNASLKVHDLLIKFSHSFPTLQFQHLRRSCVYKIRVPTFSDWQNSMIFPWFFQVFKVNFQVFFSYFLKYDFQVVLNINMKTYRVFIWTRN